MRPLSLWVFIPIAVSVGVGVYLLGMWMIWRGELSGRLNPKPCAHIWARRRYGRECAECGLREYGDSTQQTSQQPRL